MCVRQVQALLAVSVLLDHCVPPRWGPACHRAHLAGLGRQRSLRPAGPARPKVGGLLRVRLQGGLLLAARLLRLLQVVGLIAAGLQRGAVRCRQLHHALHVRTAELSTGSPLSGRLCVQVSVRSQAPSPTAW